MSSLSVVSLIALASSVLAFPSPSILSRAASPLAGKNVTLLPLGDSITYGFTDPNANGYRASLYSQLLTAGASPLDFIGSIKAGNFADPDNEGHIGYTIQQISQAATVISYMRPDVVLLHAGTNDALRGYQTSDKAINDLNSLVDQVFTQWPNSALILAKVVPCTQLSDQGNATQPYLDAINAAVPGIVSTRAAAGKKISSVDMSVIPTSQLTDGIHPTVAGYGQMANIWFPGLQDLATNGDLGSGTASSAPKPPTTTTTTAQPATTAQPSTAPATTTTAAPSPSSSPSGATAAKYGQCGGLGWTGPTVCAAGSTCTVSNPYYSQCL